MTLLTLLGLAGFTAYMASYVLLQFDRLDGNGIAYAAWNTAAAVLVLVGLVEEFNLASALIQIAWIGIGTAGVVVRLTRRGSGAAPSMGTVGTEPLIDLGESPLRLAEYYCRIGRVNDAVATYEQLANSGDRRCRGDALYALALIYRENGMVDEANEFFDLASGAVMSRSHIAHRR